MRWYKNCKTENIHFGKDFTGLNTYLNIYNNKLILHDLPSDFEKTAGKVSPNMSSNKIMASVLAES